jgi:hypothetical protein
MSNTIIVHFRVLIKLHKFQRTMEYLSQGYGFPKYRPPMQTTEMFYVLQYVPPAVRTTHHTRPSEQDALTLYEEMRPVMITLRILGVLPYSVTSTGNRKDRNSIIETNLTSIYN